MNFCETCFDALLVYGSAWWMHTHANTNSDDVYVLRTKRRPFFLIGFLSEIFKRNPTENNNNLGSTLRIVRAQPTFALVSGGRKSTSRGSDDRAVRKQLSRLSIVSFLIDHPPPTILSNSMQTLVALVNQYWLFALLTHFV